MLNISSRIKVIPRLARSGKLRRKIPSTNRSEHKNTEKSTKRSHSRHKRYSSEGTLKSCKYKRERHSEETRLSEKENLISRISRSLKASGLPPSTTSSFYQVHKKIGKGAFGKVYLATHKLTNLQVAIKRIDKSCFQNEHVKLKVLQEVFVMRKIHHSNVIRLLEVFETSRFFMIVLEFASKGDLLKLLKTKSLLSEQETKPILIDIVHGLMACHAKSIIHRDIKLDNILLTHDSRAKICDFGVSRSVRPHEVIYEQCGTPAYLAPEIIINRGYEGSYVDLWSLGVVLYTMLCGTVPFKAQTLTELHKLILTTSYTIPEHVHPLAADLIRRLLNPLPNKRISLEHILKHEWLVDSVKNAAKANDSKIKKKVIMKKLEEFGYPREYVVQSLKIHDINHTTATYNLLDLCYKD